MNVFSRAVVLGSFVGLAGCTGLSATFWTESFLNTEIEGSGFNQTLGRAYQERSSHEANDDVDWLDAGMFAEKGWKAGFDNETVLPWEPGALGLDDADMVSQRNRLMGALDNGGREQRTEACAQAQASYDMWLHEASENDSGTDAAHDTFSSWMSKCEAEAMAQPMGQTTFTIYFGFNRDNLTAEAQQVINTIVSTANEMGAGSLSVGGYTDTSGSSAYNKALGQRRADRVANALSAKGIPGGAISEQSFGESNLAVQTGDGRREPLNRRAIVTINK